MNRDAKVLIVASSVAVTAFLAVVSAGAWYVTTHGVLGATGDIRGAAVAIDEEDSYAPTSAWIEEGLDPNVTTFGFGGNAPAEPVGPELSEYQIQQLVNQRQTELMSCYADALAQIPEDVDLQGKVDIQMGIAPDGHVSMVTVTGSTLESKQTEDCIVDKARAWSFPPTNRAALMKFDTDFTFVFE